MFSQAVAFIATVGVRTESRRTDAKHARHRQPAHNLRRAASRH